MLLSSTDSHLEIECVQAMLSISDCSSLESLSTFEIMCDLTINHSLIEDCGSKVF